LLPGNVMLASNPGDNLGIVKVGSGIMVLQSFGFGVL
jgi:hypothetical protein